ncbi:MAG TPA: hypothetical protein PK954_21645, partial [Anaerolineales bacterium]|nr:hypothetical protein [Anaerolineales bacterium]
QTDLRLGYLTVRGGARIALEYGIAPIRDADDETALGLVLTFRDISGRIESERQLRFFALHDVLIGLSTRVG